MSQDPLAAHLASQRFDCDHLHICALELRETISQLFELELEVVVTADHGPPNDIAEGAELDVVFMRGDEEVRRVHGVVIGIDEQLDSESAHHAFTLHVRPAASRLLLVETQEIFMDATVPEIVATKLERVGLSGENVEMRLIEAYPRRDFVVQFRESDLAFLSRISEDVGISFFFEQRDGIDKLIFTDNAAGFHPVGGGRGEIALGPRGEHHDVFRLAWHRRAMPRAWAVHDYDYRTPDVELMGTHLSDAGTAGGVVEFGSHHETVEAAQRLARVRAEERRSESRYFSGKSAIVELTAGATVVLAGHARPELGDELLLVEVAHRLRQPALGHGDGPCTYENRFRAVPAAQTYRPPRRAPRPRIHGVLVGHVEPMPDGTIGQVAPRDDLGRYVIKFAFDASPFGERPHASLPIRMIHPHGGPGYGVQMPLETGVEVLITFIDGDPERPLIVGAGVSAVSPPPVLASEHFIHRIRTKAGVEIEMKDDF